MEATIRGERVAHAANRHRVTINPTPVIFLRSEPMVRRKLRRRRLLLLQMSDRRVCNEKRPHRELMQLVKMDERMLVKWAPPM